MSADERGTQPPIAAQLLEAVRRLAEAIGSGFAGIQSVSPLPELVAIGCLMGLLWVGIVTALDHEYRGTRAAAVHATGSLAQALEESTRRTIGQIDYILLSARGLRIALGDRFEFRTWIRTQTLADRMTAQISMANASGLMIASTKPLPPDISIADRPHFLAQIDPAHDDLFISKPVIGRVSGMETIQFTRKLLSPTGGFDGVIVLSVGSLELARYYESLGLGNGFVAILSTDGVVLARGPPMSGMTGSRLAVPIDYHSVLSRAAGVVDLASDDKQVEATASFRRLQDYPVVVMVGFDADSVFASYRLLRYRFLLSGIAITCALGFVGFFWLRQKRRSLASHRALAITLDTISQGVLMVDGQGSVSVINPQVRKLLARADDGCDVAVDLVAARARDLLFSQADGGEPSVLDPAGMDGIGADSRFETTLENGLIIEVQTHRLPDRGFVQTYTDVTEQRIAHAQVQHLAHHDALTGLANRIELRVYLSGMLERMTQRPELAALLMVDLDGFKGINDALGHDAGDELLIEVASRLRALVRAHDTVARLGGDEFVVVIAGLHEHGDVLPLAERILRRLADPVQVNGQQVRVGASAGICFLPQDGTSVDTLLKHADVALYSAKTKGRGTYRCFDHQLNKAVAEHRVLEADLRRALDTDGLEVHFQPKFNIGTMEIVGFEALARWRHPTRGFVPPDIFIALAERCGLISQLGRWVLEQACRAGATWRPRLPVAVNVSVAQLHDGGLKDDIAAALERTGSKPEHLEIEVTESVLADGDQTVLRNLQAIRTMGIGIALDDFGTGYSSLSYLRRFAFNKVKIDRSFVQGQADDPRVRVILEAILGLCHNLGLTTVGEGVETAQQLELLRERGCNEIQGYLLGRPMPPEQVQDFIGGSVALRKAYCPEWEDAVRLVT